MHTPLEGTRPPAPEQPTFNVDGIRERLNRPAPSQRVGNRFRRRLQAGRAATEGRCSRCRDTDARGYLVLADEVPSGIPVLRIHRPDATVDDSVAVVVLCERCARGLGIDGSR